MKGVIDMELNYAKVYLSNSSIIKEGYLKNWEFDIHHCTVTLWFDDGFVLRTGVNNVFMMHKDI